MIVGISSAQGQGKSTVLSSLKEMGYSVVSINTAREVISEWGTSLSEIESDPEMRVQFQNEILDRHLAAINKIENDNDVHFVERTCVDMFVYTVLSLGVFNEYDTWLKSYYEVCKKSQEVFDKVVLLEGLSTETIEKDGVRSTNSHFGDIVKRAIHRYVYEMCDESKIIHVNTANHEERITQIIKECRQ